MPKTTLVHWASQNSLKRVHPALTTCSAQFQKWKSLLCPQDMHTSNGLISNSSWILVPGVLLSLLPPGVRRSNLARVDVSTTKISRKWKIRERSRRSCTGAEKVFLWPPQALHWEKRFVLRALWSLRGHPCHPFLPTGFEPNTCNSQLERNQDLVTPKQKCCNSMCNWLGPTLYGWSLWQMPSFNFFQEARIFVNIPHTSKPPPNILWGMLGFS